jgi:oligopeptide transport system substrate-binding protein
MNLLPVNIYASLKENQEEAKKRFEIGLKDLGLTRETFPPIVISYSQHANRKEFAQYLQETWSRTFGIEIRLQHQEWNLLRTNLEKGLFDVAASFEAAYYSDPLEIMERLGEKNPANFCQWVHPGYRKLITAAILTEDTQARLDILGKAEKILLDQLPLIPVCSDRFLFAHRKGLKGYVFDSLGAIDLSYASFEGE